VVTTTMDDAEAYAYYEDPEHQEPAGPARRRAGRPLSAHVPIRFRPEVIAKLKILASREGKTVSSWVRDLVEHEVALRLPAPRSAGTEAKVTPLSSQPSTVTRTTADAAERVANYDLLSA
jgi:hypothetical protein